MNKQHTSISSVVIGLVVFLIAISCKPIGEGVTTVSVTGVTLNKDKLDLIIGKTETLTATVAPEDASNKTLTWLSGDEDVATVSDRGTVTAVAVGTAAITVTTNDGEKTATCAVTVAGQGGGQQGGGQQGGGQQGGGQQGGGQQGGGQQGGGQQGGGQQGGGQQGGGQQSGAVIAPVIAFAGDAPLPSAGTPVTLVEGYTVKLKTTMNTNVTWSSNAPTVFSVTGGVVEAKASSGTATITATATADNTKTATIDFTAQALTGSDYDGAGFTNFASPIYVYATTVSTGNATTNINYSDSAVSGSSYAASIPDNRGYELTSGANDKLVISEAASTFTINVATNGAGTRAVAVWIDWNIDGFFYGDTYTNTQPNFDATSNEFHTLTSGDNTITIPNFARVGTMRMRTQAVFGTDFYGNTPSDGSGTADYSIRDFEVEIEE